MEGRVPTRLTPAEGRKFAFTVGAAFLLFAAVASWRDHALLLRVLGGLGGTLVALGVVIPGHLSGVYRAWMGLGMAISKVTTPIVLGIVYFVVVMPVGLAIRLLGKNPMVHEPADDSYWMPHEGSPGMERQF